jgi:tetratricopeptide (TPR) repeat protein
MMTVALSGAPPSAAGFNSGQGAPTAVSSPADSAHPRELTLEQRADIFMARKSYADAADYYFRALKQSSFKNPVLWNKLGIAFQQESKLHRARQAYTHAIRMDKNFAEAWNNIGTVYFMEKKYGKSVPYYQRAIKLRDDTAAFHLNLGTSYYHLKRFDVAVEEYRTALGIDPKVVLQQSGVATVIHAGATDVEFYFYLAKAFASIGNAEDAVRYLRRALEDGYGDPKRIEEDPDFKKISQYPAFVELMRNPPVAIKN